MGKLLHRTGIALLLVLWFFPATLFCQVIKGDLSIGDTTKVHQVTTKRGDVFLGRITRIENTDVRFLLNNTIELTFQLGDLEEIRVVDQYAFDKEKGEFLKEEQQGAGVEHGFYLPTGYLLPKGEREFRNIGVLYSGLDFGLTDNFNIGFAAVPLIATNLFQLRLRAGFPLGEKVHVSLNANAYGLVFIGFFGGGAVSATGAFTFGSKEKNLTAGAGYGFILERFGIEEGGFIANMGGSYQLNNNWRLLGEFILPVGQPDVGFLFTGGANRFWGGHRLEFGLGFAWADFLIAPIPYLGYGYRFSRH